jgi:hypothetical protein
MTGRKDFGVATGLDDDDDDDDDDDENNIDIHLNTSQREY